MTNRVGAAAWRTLWAERAAGVFGSDRRGGKSSPTPDLAVAGAAGAPCMRSVPVRHPGRVLLSLSAGDARHIVRRRLHAMSALRVSLGEPGLQVIATPNLRLDRDADRGQLEEVVAQLELRQFLLDSFVRVRLR
ncbi:MAG: hypothetical protein ACREFP_07630 [Acetobacteraceae bacterium]